MNQQELNKAIATLQQAAATAQNVEQVLVQEHASLNFKLSQANNGGPVVPYPTEAVDLGAFFCVARILLLSFGYSYKQVKPKFRLTQQAFDSLKVTSNFGFFYNDLFGDE